MTRALTLALLCIIGCSPVDDAPLASTVSTRAPVERPLHAIVGIASNPQSLPLGDDDAARALRSAYWDAAADLGGVMIRRDFRWDELEPERDAFVFDGHDRLVDEANERGVRLLATLDYGNPWAAVSESSIAPPDDAADYAHYAGVVAERYAGRVIGWEIWNEPNNPFFWSEPQDEAPERYAELLSAAGEAIALADPQAEILFGGTTFTPSPPLLPVGGIEFTERALEAAPSTHHNATAFHGYMSYPPKRPPEVGDGADPTLAHKLEHHIGLQARHGDQPLWLTEIGWPAYARVTELEQARYAARAIILAARHGAEAVFWYTLFNGESVDDFIPEGGFGLLRYDASPKPAYLAIKALLDVVGERWPSETDPAIEGLPADGHAVRFTGDDDGEVIALWTVETEARISLLDAARATSMLGDALGTVTEVRIGPDVIYLTR